MIPRGVLLVVLERCGFSPNEVQRVMAEVDAEVGKLRGSIGDWLRQAREDRDDWCPARRKDNAGDWLCLKDRDHDGKHEDITGFQWPGQMEPAP